MHSDTGICWWKAIAAALALVACGHGVARADMASAYAGTVASSSLVSNPGDATGSPDSMCATTTSEPASIVLTNFGFALPAGATVQGIEVAAKVGYPSSASFGSFSVSLTANGGASFSSNSISLPGDGLVADCASTTAKTAGDSTETWGGGFGAAATINSSNFGVRLFGFSGRFIDSVQVTVYYTPAAPSPTPSETRTATATRTSTATATATATATQSGTTTETPTATATATASATPTATATTTATSTITATSTTTATPTATPRVPRFTGGTDPGATRVFGEGAPDLPAGGLVICRTGSNRVFENCGGDDIVIGAGYTDAAGVFTSSPGIPVAPPLQAGDVVCAYDAVHGLGSCALVIGPAPAPALDRTALIAVLALLVSVAFWRLRGGVIRGREDEGATRLLKIGSGSVHLPGCPACGPGIEARKQMAKGWAPWTALGLLLAAATAPAARAQQAPPEFKGVIELDVRDSTPDWAPFIPKKAPDGAPNILIVLYDDTGQAAWSTYGGRINMPTLDKLAAAGLTYSQWHTTALCSPTRSTILTGRNHHLNGMAAITEAANGFPGASGRIPPQSAPLADILRDNGYSTFWLGKDHNVPEQDVASGAGRTEWPLRMGFDRFYGFLGGETNQWYPDLVEDNRFIEPPYSPKEGYHLSKDLADQAIRMIRDQKASNPSKPWFLWFCPGANHAPHQAPQEYIDKYKGKFDDGYDAYRSWVLPRMIAKGLLPMDTELTAFNPLPQDVANPDDYVRPWESLTPDEKKLFSRLAEVYAGFSEYTDAQVGRIIDYLEKTGQLDNTIVFYAADNGASGEGTPNGSVNENKFFNGYPDVLSENMKYIDKLGGPDTYEHYPTGWAAAFSAPYKMFKRYSEYSGGTADPLVISWPKGIKARGEVRNQYHHSVDIVPTILEIVGIEMPKVYRGVEQYPLSGVSMKYTFEAKPDDPTKKHRQYYAMLGTRGIWEDGWFAAALHAPITGKGHFDQDQWQLYHVDVDRAESKDLAKENPEKLQALIKTWFEEADKNHVLPLDDRTALEQLNQERPTAEPPRERYVYYPDTAPVPEGVAASIRGRSYKILADVEITDANAGGVIFAHGSRFGGHTLFIKDGKLHYVYNFLGIAPEQEFVSGPLKPGKYTFGVEFTREKAGEHHESLGTTKLYVGDKVVAQGPMKTQPGKFTLSGDGLCVGYDSGDAVSAQYSTPATFHGGRIVGVAVTVEQASYTDLEKEAAAAFARD